MPDAIDAMIQERRSALLTPANRDPVMKMIAARRAAQIGGIPTAEEEAVEQHYRNPLVRFGLEELLSPEVTTAASFALGGLPAAATNVGAQLASSAAEEAAGATGVPPALKTAVGLLAPIALGQYKQGLTGAVEAAAPQAAKTGRGLEKIVEELKVREPPPAAPSLSESIPQNIEAYKQGLRGGKLPLPGTTQEYLQRPWAYMTEEAPPQPKPFRGPVAEELSRRRWETPAEAMVEPPPVERPVSPAKLDVLAAHKIGKAFNSAKPWSTRTPAAEDSFALLIADTNMGAHRGRQFAANAAKSEAIVEGWGSAEHIDFIDHIQRNKIDELPAAKREIAKRLERKFNQDVQSITDEFGEKYAPQVREFYFPTMFKDQKAADAFIQRQRSIGGRAGFLQPKQFDYFKDAIDPTKGNLEPVSTNPITLSVKNNFAVERYKSALRLAKHLEEYGIGLPKEKAPDWFLPLHQRWLSHLYVPPEVAKLFDRYLQPGLRGNKLYDAAASFTAMTNQLKFGLSGWHALVTALVSQTEDLALVAERGMTPKGRLFAGMRGVTPAISLVRQMRIGKQLYQGVKGEGPDSLQRLGDLLVKSGAIIDRDPMYTQGHWLALKKAWNDPDVVKRAVGVGRHGVQAAFEQASRPIMEGIVPLSKYGAWWDLMRANLSRLPEGATELDQIKLGQEMWRVVEERHGQMNQDLWGISRTLRDILHVTVQSPGWTGGTLLAGGKGAADIARLRLTPRANFMLAAGIIAPLTGAYTERLLSGKWPEIDLEHPADSYWRLLHPRGSDGEPLSFPFYVQEWAKWVPTRRQGIGPAVRTAQGKLAAIPKIGIDMIRQHDYRGVEVGVKDWPKTVGKELVPFVLRDPDVLSSVTGGLVRSGEKISAGQVAERFMGFRPASRAEKATAAESILMDEKQRTQHVRTAEEAAQAEKKGKLIEALREKKPADFSGLSRFQQEDAVKAARKPRIVDLMQSASPAASIDAYEVATQDERDQMAEALVSKVENMKDKDEQQRLYARLVPLIRKYPPRRKKAS